MPWFWKGEYEGGNADPAYCELYVRWLQYGVFLPIFRSHGTDCRREPWNFGDEGDPFMKQFCLLLLEDISCFFTVDLWQELFGWKMKL